MIFLHSAKKGVQVEVQDFARHKPIIMVAGEGVDSAFFG